MYADFLINIDINVYTFLDFIHLKFASVVMCIAFSVRIIYYTMRYFKQVKYH